MLFIMESKTIQFSLQKRYLYIYDRHGELFVNVGEPTFISDSGRLTFHFLHGVRGEAATIPAGEIIAVMDRESTVTIRQWGGAIGS